MTTNQTIDGVPRELLERIIKNGMIGYMAYELRTLLDASVIGWKVWGGDRCDHCCNGDRCEDTSHVERSKCQYCKGTGMAIWLTKPAAQPRGEPLAWISWTGGDCPIDADVMVEYAMASNPQRACGPEVACRLDWSHDKRPTKLGPNIVKYREIAEQPAPVAVVLPARPRADEEEYERMTDYEKGLLHGGIELWDKIDELARLNASRPTHANPPPGTEPSGTHPHNDGLDEMRKPK